MNRKGVTLIELIVVMVIIAIGAALMAPNIGGWLPNYRLRSATRDIVSTMREAQMKAVSQRTQYQVSFNIAETALTTNTAYILRHDSGGIFITDGAVTRLPTGITINVNTFNNSRADFFPNPPSGAGSLTLINTKGAVRIINLNGATGRATIQ